MLLQHLESLRAHGAWADARLLHAARTIAGDATEVLRELGHIRGAQEVWLSRIEGRTATLAVWPTLSADELARIGAELDGQLQQLLAGLIAADLARVVEYRTLAGVAYRTPLGEILLHAMMHGHYHRGKANIALRDAGATPVGVDYILWHREVTSPVGSSGV